MATAMPGSLQEDEATQAGIHKIVAGIYKLLQNDLFEECPVGGQDAVRDDRSFGLEERGHDVAS